MLHDWMFDAATDEDRAILQEMLEGVGAIVMGRKGFDKNEGDGVGATAAPSAVTARTDADRGGEWLIPTGVWRCPSRPTATCWV
jgi:hypothetical protein